MNGMEGKRRGDRLIVHIDKKGLLRYNLTCIRRIPSVSGTRALHHKEV
jgi:hypothetical protein